MYFLNTWLFLLLGKPADFIKLLKPFRIALITTTIALIYIIVKKRRDVINIIKQSRQCRLFLYYYIAMFVSIPFALYSKLAFNTVVNVYSLYVVMFIVIIVCYNTQDKLKNIMAILVFANIFLIAMSLLNIEDMSSRFEFKNTGYDPNDTVFLILSLMPGSMYYTRYFKNRLYRLIPISVIIINIYVILITGSRGGFLGLIAFMIGYGLVLVKGENIFRKIALVLLSVLMLSLFLYKSDQSRIYDIFSPNDYNYTEETGRWAIWKHTIEIIIENPIFGVGASCLPEAIGNLRAVNNLPPKWQTAHNTFLQVTSEIGLIGLVLFTFLIYGTYQKFNIVIINGINENLESETIYISKCMKIVYLSSIVCSLFLSNAYSIIMVFYFAVGESLSYICRKSVN